MSRQRQDLWRQVAEHPVYTGVSFIGSICSIASFVLPMTGNAPPVMALFGVVMGGGAVGMAYLTLRHHDVGKKQAHDLSEQQIAAIAHLEHNTKLIPQDILGLLDEWQPAEAALYREATSHLERGELVETVEPVLVCAAGDAIQRWVAIGYALLREGYPGTVSDPQKKEDVLNRIHRAAYKWMHTGRVITFSNDGRLRELCIQIAKSVELWVERKAMERL